MQTNVRAVNETIDAQHPVVLASGNEAVAGIAEKLMKLSPSQRSFLRLRFYYETDSACATKVGIAPATVKLWKRDDGFNAAYRELLAQPLLHARAELLLLSSKAINVLADLLDHPSPSFRLAAVEKVLKGRDAQLVANSLKVEAGDGGDLYTQLLQGLASSRTARIVEPSTADEGPEKGQGNFLKNSGPVVDAEFHEVPDLTPTP
jgi:hypothetical protein